MAGVFGAPRLTAATRRARKRPLFRGGTPPAELAIQAARLLHARLRRAISRRLRAQVPRALETMPSRCFAKPPCPPAKLRWQSTATVQDWCQARSSRARRRIAAKAEDRADRGLAARATPPRSRCRRPKRQRS